MAKVARSMTSPSVIEVDKVKNGSVRLLCHWDIKEIEVTMNENGKEETHTEYEYKEKVIWWALPSPTHLERQGTRQIITDEGRNYLSEMETEILDWAMAAGV